MDDPFATAGAAARFQCDLYRYWRAARRAGSLALGARGYLALAAFRRVAARLNPGAPAAASDAPGEAAGEAFQPRLLFIRRLLERLDLLEPCNDQRLCAADPSVMAAYLELPLAERVRRCVRVWIAGGWLPDVLDARRPLPSPRAPAPPRIALARRHLLHDLLALPPGATLPIPIAPVPTPVGARRANQRAARPTVGDGATERAALLGPLRWLGLVALDTAAIAGERDGGDESAQTCRTTPTLDALRASDGGAELAETHGRIMVQANFEIVAYPPYTAPALSVLDGCAEPRGEDRVARHPLSPRAVATARRLGWPAGAVASRLVALAGAALPPNVAVTLADWDRQAGRLSLQAPVTLLEVADPALLDALLRDGHAAMWVARRLAPGTALIHERHRDDVRAWLLRHGELPALVDDATERSSDEPS